MAQPILIPRDVLRQLALIAVALLLALSACGGGGDGANGDVNAQDVGDSGVVAAVEAYPASGVAPLTANLDGSGSWALDGGALTYSWDFDGDGVFDKLDGGATESYTWEKAGTYNVVLLVTDASGNHEYDTVAVTVTAGTSGEGGEGESSSDPVAQLSVWPSTGAAPLEVTIDASGCWAQDGGALTYEYDYEGDGTYDLETSEASVTHIYAEGSYTPAIRVTDSDGRTATAAGKEITVSAETGGGTEEQGPIAVLLATPVYGAPPLAVELDASSSVALGAAIASYDWDLDGDGEYEVIDGGSQQAVSYTVEGLFYVNVRVTDADGRSGTGQAAIVVSASL